MDSFETLGGRRAAIDKLYEACPFTRTDVPHFENADARVSSVQVLMLEGIDFDLTFFPFEHLGYKAVLQATGKLYSRMAAPALLNVVIGVSSKLDYPQISEIWKGVARAAGEFSYSQLSLDLRPSLTGLSISVSATGYEESSVSAKHPVAKSMDLICVSNNFGAAFLGEQILRKCSSLEEDERKGKLSSYLQLVGAYLKPDLSPSVLQNLNDAGIMPSFGFFSTDSLRETVLELCRASGLGAKIYVDRIPLAGGSVDCAKELGIDPMQAVLRGGDDCCLVFTVPIGNHERFRHDFQTWDVIGHLAKPEVGAVLVSPDGLEHTIQ